MPSFPRFKKRCSKYSPCGVGRSAISRGLNMGLSDAREGQGERQVLEELTLGEFISRAGQEGRELRILEVRSKRN